MKRSYPHDIVPMLAALRAGLYQQNLRDDDAKRQQPHPPFITISRQAGAGGRSIAKQLADRLNDEIDPGELSWTVWDNELVERVAAEHDLPVANVAALEGEPPTWLEQALCGLAIESPANHPDELKVYHRVATTIRALAEIGRVVIVGRGAALITRDMTGGTHLRLVAPLEYRIAATAKAMGASAEVAAAVVRQKDHSRESFYRRYWPNHPLVPENFTATFNTAAVTREQLVECVLSLIVADETKVVPAVTSRRCGGVRCGVQLRGHASSAAES